MSTVAAIATLIFGVVGLISLGILRLRGKI